MTDFLTGVLSALVLYGVLYRFFDSSDASKGDDSKRHDAVDHPHERRFDPQKQLPAAAATVSAS
jgi:hypothetical protein